MLQLKKAIEIFKGVAMAMKKFDFENSSGLILSGRLELPEGEVETYAIFAHCFTCSKSASAASKISRGLASRGIAVLRFDFTGLGNSEGDFENSNFLANVADIVSASQALTLQGMTPTLLIGHSLGGAAVLQACKEMESISSVVTIGAPSDTEHVTHLFSDSLETISKKGRAEVNLGGRSFMISEEFVKTLKEADVLAGLRESKKAFLVMHSPVDEVVSIDHAANIFLGLKHPRSFVSLDQADHLLSDPAHGDYCAGVIRAWL